MKFTIEKEALDPNQLVYIRGRKPEGKYRIERILYFNFAENEFCYILHPTDEDIQDQTEAVAMDRELEPAPEANNIWELKKGDTYYTIASNGKIQSSKWQVGEPGKCQIELQLQAIGEIYLTKEDALTAFNKKKVIAKLLKYGARHIFKKHGYNYFIVKDESNFVRCSLYSDDTPSGHWYFDSKEAIEQAVKDIGGKNIYKALYE